MEKMTEKIFEVQGTITKKDSKQKFIKKVSSLNTNTAIEKVFSLFGSKNKAKRRDIEITEVKEVAE